MEYMHYVVDVVWSSMCASVGYLIGRLQTEHKRTSND